MPGGRRRILVVEDEPETAGQIVESLATSGYRVIWPSTAMMRSAVDVPPRMP
jgi:two-component system OmpR family response regulator